MGCYWRGVGGLGGGGCAVMGNRHAHCTRRIFHNISSPAILDVVGAMQFFYAKIVKSPYVQICEKFQIMTNFQYKIPTLRMIHRLPYASKCRHGQKAVDNTNPMYTYTARWPHIIQVQNIPRNDNPKYIQGMAKCWNGSESGASIKIRLRTSGVTESHAMTSAGTRREYWKYHQSRNLRSWKKRHLRRRRGIKQQRSHALPLHPNWSNLFLLAGNPQLSTRRQDVCFRLPRAFQVRDLQSTRTENSGTRRRKREFNTKWDQV